MFTEQDWKAQNKPLLKLEPDIWQLRLPLPYALDHVNVYLIQGDNGWTVVDTGLNISKARSLWEQTFVDLKIEPGSVEQIVVTHGHPDHFGMAGWLQQQFSTSESQVPVYISATDHYRFAEIWEEDNIHLTLGRLTQFMVFCGLPVREAETITQRTMGTASKTMPHPTFTPMPENGTIQMGNRTWEVIHAPGHADGQMIFYDASDHICLSADQLLMKITPNIGFWDHTMPGVLKRYLDSLSELKNYDVRYALPGHKWLIGDWNQCIDEMFEHHKERLAKTHESVKKATGVTAHVVSQDVFRLSELNEQQSSFAIAETLAHLDFLEGNNTLRKEIVEGVWRFSVV